MMNESINSDSQLDRFLELSTYLTGFNRFDLVGTKQAKPYFDWVQAEGEAQVGQMLDAFARSPAHPVERQAYVDLRILQSDTLGPLARSIIKLWYLGQWFVPGGTDTCILSAGSYRHGLVWKAIGAHPLGAAQQGFGAWSEPPAAAGAINLTVQP